MGTTSLSANMDFNVIRGLYRRTISVGESIAIPDVTIALIHRFKNSAGATSEIVLETSFIPAKAIKDTGHLGLSPKTQTLEYMFLNPRYINSLFVEITEVRDNTTEVKRVPVLIGDELAKPAEPTNIIKEREHEENIPVEVPENDISIPEPVLLPVVYLFSKSGLKPSQISARAYLEGETWKTQDFGVPAGAIYIENAISNLLPNPIFLGNDIPTGYTIDGPGITYGSAIKPGPIAGTFIWVVDANNPNLFSPTDHIIFSTGSQPLTALMSKLTFSIYYTLTMLHTGSTPFETFSMSITFFDSLMSPVSTNDVEVTAIESGSWQLLDATWNVPVTAAYYEVSWGAVGITDTDRFVMQWYLPQLETGASPTTRTKVPAELSRIEDIYHTSSDISLVLPLFFSLKTIHMPASDLRGLVDTTTALTDGFQWAITPTNRLLFRTYSPLGATVASVLSDPFSIAEGEETIYGIYLDGLKVDFFIDGNLVSSHPVVYPINTNNVLKEVVVGSLITSNNTINSKILDFIISKVEP